MKPGRIINCCHRKNG